MNNDIRCDNRWAYDNDSSNHCKEGEGIPEATQRLAKEAKDKEFMAKIKIVAARFMDMLYD